MRKLSIAFMILTMFVGVGFFIYPDVASWWNGREQAGLVDTYQRNVEALQQEQIDAHIQHARNFNEALTTINISDPFADADTLSEDYLNTLNVGGIMATIEIPSIGVNLPVRHGTSHYVLDRGAGHLAGTSFPIGGIGTHAVITAHSGLPNARMFSPLLDERFGVDDYFFINVMGIQLMYRVIQLEEVYPEEVDRIYLTPGEDLVTLITCTPFAINTHRLLVRGTRVHVEDVAVAIAAIEPVISTIEANWRLAAAVAGFGVFLLVFVVYQIVKNTRSKWRKKGEVVLVPVIATPDYNDDPYISIPATYQVAQQATLQQGSLQQAQNQARQQMPQIAQLVNQSINQSGMMPSRVTQNMDLYERVTPMERSAAKRRKSTGRGRQLAMACVAILMLLGGAAVILFPQVQRIQSDRQHESLISDWQESLDESRHFIQRRWLEQRTAFESTLRSLPIMYINGGQLVTYDHMDICYWTGEITDTVYVPIGPLSFEYGNQLYVGPNGYLTLGGQPLGNPQINNGYLTIGDLFVATNGTAVNGGLSPYQPPGQDEPIAGLYVSNDGSFYINFGGGVYLGTNGGNVSMLNIAQGPSGGVYIGGIPIEDLVAEEFPFYDFDLDFIFNFDLNQDPLYWLNNAMHNHNEVLYENEQQGLTSLEATEEVDFSVTELAGFTEEMLGFVEIPLINIRIPIFAGSSEANMIRGAAHMTHTSLPVGGENTNSVITAHRGLTRARMFRDLDQLKNTNEIIYITNPYQTLRYQVFHHQIVPATIAFDERDAIMIAQGRDMITLLTCHPYRINNERLLIFAERVPD